MSNQLSKEPLVLVSKQAGVTVIPSDTLLTRLNYFDGKFLRADDLRAEQQYLRYLVQVSNQAGGHGVAHGYTVTLGGGGDTLNVGPGLAVDPAGRVLLMPQPVSVNVQQLIEQSKELLKVMAAMQAAAGGGGFSDCEFVAGEPPTNVPQAGELYLITVSHAEAYCGHAEVFGKLCEEACVTSTDRPFVVEGVVLRALPLTLQTPLPQSSAVLLSQLHLRSRVASAYFNDERLRTPSLISKAGLASSVWCFGAEAAAGSDVPIAVIARGGQATLFLDAWTARRERIDPQARRYWQWRMRMRPWDVFLAHVLQFQCHLSEILKTTPDPGSDDPCLDERKVIAEAAGLVAELNAYFAGVSAKLAALNLPDPNAVKAALGLTDENFAKYGDLQKKLDTAKEADFTGKLDHLLVNGGIVELPSAGYLPVAPSSTVSVNRQVRAMLGDGVDLRFCVVRPDYPAHALEAAQHMERISLLEGLDDPGKKPEVDILVPDGEILTGAQAAGGGFQAAIDFTPHLFEVLNYVVDTGDLNTNIFYDLSASFRGVVRGEELAGGGRAVRAGLLLDDFQTERDLRKRNAADSYFDRSAGDLAKEYGDARTSDAGADAAASAEERQRLLTRMKGAMRNRGGQSANAAVAGGEPQTASISTGGAPPNVQGGLWFDMSCDKNPLTLKQGGVLQADGRVTIAASGTFNQSPVSGYFDTRLHADVIVTGVETLPGGGKLVKCGVSLSGLVITKFGYKESDARTVNLDVELRWEPPGTFKIKARNSGGGGEAGSCVVTWGGNPRTFQARVVTEYDDAGDDVAELTDGHFVSDPAVAEPSDPNHVKALSALQVVGTALNDPAFTALSSALLFPAPPQAEGMTVLAKHDWVLFHRRRTRQCEVEAPAPPVAAPTRRYNLYMVRDRFLKSVPEAIAKIRSTFPNINAEQTKGLTLIDVVEFAGGSQALASNASTLLSKWEAAGALDQIFYGLIASGGAAAQEGEATAKGRLTSAGQVIGQAASLHPQAEFDVFPAVPAPLAAPGSDGVIIFVTTGEAPVEQMRHAVYRVSKGSTIVELHELVQKGQELTAPLLHKLEAFKVGEVTFEDDPQNTVPDNSLTKLAEEWAEHGGGMVGDALVVMVGLSELGRATAQEAVIMDKLTRHQTANRLAGNSSHALPDGCRFVSFFTTERIKV